LRLFQIDCGPGMSRSTVSEDVRLPRVSREPLSLATQMPPERRASADVHCSSLQTQLRGTVPPLTPRCAGSAQHARAWGISCGGLPRHCENWRSFLAVHFKQVALHQRNKHGSLQLLSANCPFKP